MQFKQWFTESINFPNPENLDEFLDYAIVVCIKTHHKLPPSQLKSEIISLTDLLENIQKKVKTHVVHQPLVDDKFKKYSFYLQKNEYPHRFPNFESILKVLQTLGSNYLIDKGESIAISEQLQKLRDLQH